MAIVTLTIAVAPTAPVIPASIVPGNYRFTILDTDGVTVLAIRDDANTSVTFPDLPLNAGGYPIKGERLDASGVVITQATVAHGVLVIPETMVSIDAPVTITATLS